MPQLVIPAAFAAATTAVSVGIEMGINYLTRPPEPEGTIKSFTQARPERCILMGNPSRMSGAFMGAAQ